MTEATETSDETKQSASIIQLNKLDFYDKALGAMIIIIAIMQIYFFSQLLHIASPVYGGDLYRERGFIQYILNGNKYWTDPYFKGELEFYPPLGYLLGAFLSKITGASIDTVINFLPIFVMTAITIAFYKLGTEIFKRKQQAFFLAATGGTVYNLFPVKHTYGISVFFAIMFLAYFFKLEKNDDLKTKIIAGLYFGLAALTHYQPFLYTTVMVGTTIILELFYKIKTEKIICKNIKETIKKYFITFFVAGAIAMIFFAPLILKYQMKTPNKTQEYSQFDTSKNGIGWLVSTVFNQFIQTTSTPHFLLGATMLGGLAACLLNLNKKEQRYTIFLFAGMIISGGHYLITKPLLNMWVVPSHMMAGLFIPSSILFAWGVKFFQALTEQKKQAYGKFAAPIIFLAIIIPLLNFNLTNYNNDRWTQYGRQMDAGTQTLYNIGEWMLANTNNQDVFLANDESAFALNALSGRWVVAVRRTHASPYADVDKRYADAMVMLYGNKIETTKDLLKNYSVSYVYIDQYLMTQPMITSTKFADYLKENEVNFTIQNVRLDPADINTPVYESIVVPPQQLKITENNTTKPLKQFNVGNQAFSVVYKVTQ